MSCFGHNGKAYLVAFSLAGLVAVTTALVGLRHSSDPQFEGKRVSAWFDQLFSQECNSNNVPISYATEGAFKRMIPEVAVPFLAAKLKYNPAWDELLSWLKQNRFTRRFTRRLIPPADRRLTAASLLLVRGPAASNAVPALLVACKQDPSRRVRMQSVYTMAFVLDRKPHNGGVLMSDWARFESAAIAAAAEHYPDTAQKLRISVQRNMISELGGAANRSQPIRSETNSTSSAAASRR